MFSQAVNILYLFKMKNLKFNFNEIGSSFRRKIIHSAVSRFTAERYNSRDESDEEFNIHQLREDTRMEVVHALLEVGEASVLEWESLLLWLNGSGEKTELCEYLENSVLRNRISLARILKGTWNLIKKI